MKNEFMLNIKVELLPEGLYLATSDELPSLLAQGKTVSETIEIAKSVAEELIKSYQEHGDPLPQSLKRIENQSEFNIAVGF